MDARDARVNWVFWSMLGAAFYVGVAALAPHLGAGSTARGSGERDARLAAADQAQSSELASARR
jgi:hypothetical protein